jgi:hypothetical protein
MNTRNRITLLIVVALLAAVLLVKAQTRRSGSPPSPSAPTTSPSARDARRLVAVQAEWAGPVPVRFPGGRVRGR